MGRGKKIPSATAPIKIRLYEADVLLLRDLFPSMHLAEIVRALVANYCQNQRKAMDQAAATFKETP